MALTTRHPGSIIISTELSGSWVAYDEKPNVTSGGWDSLKRTYYRTSSTPLEVEDIMAEFPTGEKLGTRTFWLTDVEGPTCVVAGLYKIEANYKGFAAPKPVVTNYGAAVNEQTAQNVTIGGILYDNATIYENGNTASVRYVLEDYIDAPTDEVGTPKVPPNAQNVAPSRWLQLETFNYNSPNGWVLMSSSTDVIPGTTVAFMTDDYQFIHAITP